VDILTQLNRAVAYIEKHIDDDINPKTCQKSRVFRRFISGGYFITSPI
jgi:hypothetical protein